jgi:hypothetical protein
MLKQVVHIVATVLQRVKGFIRHFSYTTVKKFHTKKVWKDKGFLLSTDVYNMV